MRCWTVQTELASFSQPAHVRTVERIQRRAADALDDDLEQSGLSEVVE